MAVQVAYLVNKFAGIAATAASLMLATVAAGTETTGINIINQFQEAK